MSVLACGLQAQIAAPPRFRAVSRAAEVRAFPRPPIIEPADWGSRPGDMSRVPRHDRFAWITLHHAGVPWKADKDAVKFVCDMQAWAKSPPEPPRREVWNELPYHFMISPDGRIFAARPLQYQAATNTHYDVAENITIELMGDFERQRPRAEQLRAAVALTAWLSQRYGIALDHIRGHKDAPGADGTDCPGKDFARYLAPEGGAPPLFRAWVTESLAGRAPNVARGEPRPSGPDAESPAGLPAADRRAWARCR